MVLTLEQFEGPPGEKKTFTEFLPKELWSAGTWCQHHSNTVCLCPKVRISKRVPHLPQGSCVSTPSTTAQVTRSQSTDMAMQHHRRVFKSGKCVHHNPEATVSLTASSQQRETTEAHVTQRIWKMQPPAHWGNWDFRFDRHHVCKLEARLRSLVTTRLWLSRLYTVKDHSVCLQTPYVLAFLPVKPSTWNLRFHSTKH